MKRLAIILAVLPAIVSCTMNFGFVPIIGNGKLAEKSFTFESFDGIVVKGAVDVVFIPTVGESSAVLRTDENLLDAYTLEVVGGELVISSEKGKNPMPKDGTKVTVKAPTISKMHVSGSGDCSIDGALVAPGDFSFSVSGSGDLEAVSIACRNFTSKVSGSGDVEADAILADSATFTISGSGDIEVKSVTAESLSVGISGSGSADIGCKEAGDIDVRISGSGSIRLYGSARSLNQKVSGSGSINVRNLSLSR